MYKIVDGFYVVDVKFLINVYPKNIGNLKIILEN